MNTENMLKFVEALESGKYPQAPGGGLLRTTEGYCCLGVLEEIRGTESKLTGSVYRFGPNEFQALPDRDTVTDFLGIPNGFPEYPGERDVCSTIKVTDDEGVGVYVHFLNDQGVPFKEIARLIRREFGLPPAP